jgi:RHS repeat-associated protein
MFEFRHNQVSAIRRKRIGAAFASSFADTSLRAQVEPDSGDVLVSSLLRQDTTRYSFDQQGFIGRITTPLGRTWQLRNDEQGRMAALTNPAGHMLGVAYDARGRISQLQRQGQPVLQFQYDERNNHTRTLYADSTAETVSYRDERLITAIEDRNGTRAQFEHDGQDCLTRLVDGNGHATEFTYEEWDRPARATFANGHMEQYGYDPAGYLQRISQEEGHSAEISRNEAGRPTRIVYNDGLWLQYRYDDQGRLTHALSEVEAVSWRYDAEGRVIEESTSGGSVQYLYDDTGQLSGLRYPDGSTITFTSDADGLLASVQDWSGTASYWEYAPAEGGWTVTYPGAVQSTKELALTGMPVQWIVRQRGGASLLHLRYQQDAEDRVSFCEDSLGGFRDFAYDPAGRLLRAGREQFAYDAAGNLTIGPLGPVVYNELNQPVSVESRTLRHDGRGNLLEGPGPGGWWRYGWDARNRLVRAEGPQGQVIEYGYDALDRRRWRREGSHETVYLWAGETLISEIERQWGTVIRSQEYLFQPGTQTLLATRINSHVYYCHTDHLGTPRLLTDAIGQVVWAATYTAWGDIDQVWGSGIHQPWRFPGQYADAVTGLHDNRFRTYHPGLGRYLSRDPLSYLGGLHLYAYAGLDPVNNADPLGLWGWKGIVSAVAAVAVGVAVTAAVIATAPVSVPALLVTGAAIVAGGAAAGAVGFGLNEALNEKEFCATCIGKEALKGALVGAASALPFAFLPASAGIAAFAGVGALSGAIGYTGSYLTHPGMPWSWGEFAGSVALGAVTAGAGRYLGPKVAGLFKSEPEPVAQPRMLPAPKEEPPPTAQQQVEDLSGHGHGRHGSQTTTQQQETRVQTGVAANGDVTKKPPTSTRFDSPEAELDAVQRAQVRTAQRIANGQKSTAIEVAPDGTAKLPRDVSTVTGYPKGYGSGVTVIKDPVTGKALPGRPVQPTGQMPNATVVLEYNPATGSWEPITQFPSNDPVSP